VPPPPHSWLTSPWLILLLLGLLVVVAVPVMLYLWLNSEGETSWPPGSRRRIVAFPPFPMPCLRPVRHCRKPLLIPQPGPPTRLSLLQRPSSVEPAACRGRAPEAGKSVLHLEFGDESWVEIKDASGRMLHRQLNPPAAARTSAASLRSMW
jgi:cytoskeleton protein RodZ